MYALGCGFGNPMQQAMFIECVRQNFASEEDRETMSDIEIYQKYVIRYGEDAYDNICFFDEYFYE